MTNPEVKFIRIPDSDEDWLGSLYQVYYRGSAIGTYTLNGDRCRVSAADGGKYFPPNEAGCQAFYRHECDRLYAALCPALIAQPQLPR